MGKDKAELAQGQGTSESEINKSVSKFSAIGLRFEDSTVLDCIVLMNFVLLSPLLTFFWNYEKGADKKEIKRS